MSDSKNYIELNPNQLVDIKSNPIMLLNSEKTIESCTSKSLTITLDTFDKDMYMQSNVNSINITQ